jgi:hypothetical protein
VYQKQAQACCGAPGLEPVYDGPHHNWRVGEDHGHLPLIKLLLLLVVVKRGFEFYLFLFFGDISLHKNSSVKMVLACNSLGMETLILRLEGNLWKNDYILLVTTAFTLLLFVYKRDTSDFYILSD